MSLKIYKSSAGSGKTYTLAKEYLKLALRSEDYYQKILAVTFTNRAAEEMKERVLEFLISISKGEHELVEVFAEELGKSADEIQQRASDTLSHLLHHYSFFNITTIDTFFHRVIRAFSREIGLQGNFGIELDTDKVSEFITSSVYEGVEENAQLKDWLIDFSMSKLMDGKGYEYRSEVSTLAKQLFSEEFKRLPSSQWQDEETKLKIKELKNDLIKKKSVFEGVLTKIANEFDEAISNAGLSIDDLSYKTSGPGGFFPKLHRKEYDSLLTKRVEEGRNDPEAWTSKSSSHRDLILQKAQTHFMPLLNEAVDYLEKNERDYYTCKVILKHLYTLGLMTDLSHRLQDYKREEEVIMISDLPDFLSQIIDDSGSPFIYEKVGSRYAHFLIDEFQDTSQFQWNNFKPLLEESMANGNENIIVGDAKQSIYGWRGADPTLLLNKVQQDIPMAHADEERNTNWRSASNIVNFNNHVFSKLPSLMTELMGEVLTEEEQETIKSTYAEVEQKVAPKNEDKGGLVQLEFLTAEKGERWNGIALGRMMSIMEDLIQKGHKLNDMAILVRTNNEAAQVVNHVLEYRKEKETSIEVISAEGMLLANSSVVQLLVSAMNHLINPEDQSVLADLVFRYRQDSKGTEQDSHEDFTRLVPEELPGVFNKFKQHFLHLPIIELVEVLIRTFHLDTIQSEYAYLQAFQDAVLEYSKNNRSDVRLFMEWWEDVGAKRSVQLTGALDAVEVITSHKAKGLQYPIVFVPFCNFKFDSKSHPSWYQAPEKYNQLESIPVDYKSELDKTHFSSNYKKEHAKWHLESLNVLYVAFTRAQNGLYAFCDPNDRASAYGSASKLIMKLFEVHPLEGWVQAASIFRIGELPIKHLRNSEQLISLAGYPTHKWSNKLSIRKTGKAYYDDEIEKQRNEGILLHQILSEVIHWEDLDNVLDRYEKRMDITRDDKSRFSNLIKNLWANDQVKSWFDGEGEVKTEVVVLPKDGETKRMDRVILKGEQAIVIDFKSGQPRTADNRQVKEYMQLLKEMGYQTEGYLLYLHNGEVVSI